MSKSFRIILILGCLFSAEIFSASKISIKYCDFVEEIAQRNLQNFPWQEEEWEENDYEVFLKRSVEKRLNPLPRSRRQGIITFFKKYFAKKGNLTLCTDMTTWDNLGLIAGKNGGNYVSEVLDRTISECGAFNLVCLLSNPIDKVDELEKRQAIIRTLVREDGALLNELDLIFSKLATAENMVLSCWGQDNFKHAVKNFYFSLPLLEKLNQSSSALLARSTLEHQKRLCYNFSTLAATFVLAAYATKLIVKSDAYPSLDGWADFYKYEAGMIANFISSIPSDIVQGFGMGLCSYWCWHNFQDSFKWSQTCFLIELCIQKVMIEVANYVRMMEQAYHLVRQHETLRSCDEFKSLTTFFEDFVPRSENVQELFSLLAKHTFVGKGSILSNKGAVLRSYKLFHEVKSEFENVIMTLGKLDMYLACAKLYKEYQDKEYQGGSVGFCFPTYAQNETPLLNLKDFWHPCIDPNVVVVNSVALGTSELYPNNMIITGPNAGGKSTILKSIVITIFMAQTIGIAPASSMYFTPFSVVTTYLNITDDLGSGNSLFKAEVARTQELVSRIQSMDSGTFSLTLFDEIFTGTSPLEGMATSYSVTKYLGSLNHSLCLVATHFPLLTELEQSNNFKNYKVSVVKREGQGIEYPYKLEPGIAHQNVALDILASEGFSSAILTEAQSIIDQQA